jgi:uncharacterized membrane protein
MSQIHTPTKHPFQCLALLLFAMCFVASGIAHFVLTASYAQIVPPYLPWPRALVYVTGVGEILCGLGLPYKPTRRVAAWGSVGLLIALFPANLYMAMAHVDYAGPAWVLWARLPLQVPLMAWGWVYTRRVPPRYAD